MATHTAPAPWPAPPPARQLWQVPAFFLGLAALATLLLLRPLWHSPERVANHRLTQARRQLQRADGADRAAALAQAHLDQVGPNGDRAGEAYFLLGSAQARTARTAPLESTAAAWRSARVSLEQAERLGVPADDENALHYRLGVCGFYTGADPRRIVRLLAGSVTTARDKVEGYRLLTLAYLRLPAPDLEAALKANEALRQLPLVGEDVLGPARVQGGELLLRLRRPVEARAVLQKVSAAAPSVLAEARALRARSHQDEGNWAEAAALWQDILADRRRPPTQPGPVLYQLGVCFRRLEQFADAARVWGDCIKRGDPKSATAASLGLAGVLLIQGKPDAVAAYEQAVRDVRRPEEWDGALVDLKQARTAFEVGCQAYRDRGDFERALRLAELYDRLAAPGQGPYLRGQAAEEWARALRERPPPPGADPVKRAAQATDLYRQAGDAYGRSAELTPVRGEQAERLWLAAGCYLRGQDAGHAAPVLQRFLELGERPDFAGEGWFLLGEARRWLGRTAEAEEAYRECVKYPGRFAFRARFQLSEAALGRGQVDRAADILRQNITQLHLQPDDEALEKSLYAYGALVYKGGDHLAARVALEEAVGKFPNSPSARRGRFELAESCRNLAAKVTEALRRQNPALPTREHYLKQQRLWLEKAVEQYAALASPPAGAAADTLTPQEQVHVLFSAAECRFNLGEYDAARKLYDQLAERFKGRAERLNALGGSARCYGTQKKYAKFQERLQDIRVALEGVDAETRHQWEEWLKVAGRQPDP